MFVCVIDEFQQTLISCLSSRGSAGQHFCFFDLFFEKIRLASAANKSRPPKLYA